MSKTTITTAVLLFLSFSGINFPQMVHVITVQDFSFTPQSLTVQVGDTVRWNAVQGHHNVRADDNSFTSGPPATAPWTFNHVFASTGTNPYYCEPHGGPGGTGMSGTVIVTPAVSVDENKNVVKEFKLDQNYPNPFNPSTSIKFQIPSSGFVSLKVYDLLGREVSTLISEYKSSGNYEIEFNASKLTSGFYIYQLKSSSFIQTKKMLLLK
jgi:plastocyanin